MNDNSNPFAAPSAQGTLATTRLDLRAIGLAQRSLLWLVLVYLVIVLFMVGIPEVAEASPLFRLLLLPFQFYFVYRLARAMKLNLLWTSLSVLLQLIPFVSLIVLLALSAAATRRLQFAGIHVGLLGPKMADLPPESLSSPPALGRIALHR